MRRMTLADTDQSQLHLFSKAAWDATVGEDQSTSDPCAKYSLLQEGQNVQEEMNEDNKGRNP